MPLDDAKPAAIPLEIRTWTRRGERRADLRQVIGALAAALAVDADQRSLYRVFESELSQVLPVRGIRLREVPSRYQARLVTPTRSSDSIVLDVPTGEPGRQAVLEAAFVPGCGIDQWGMDLLASAAQLGAVVLEAERRRGLPMRRSDGAAPLIGSTRVMQALRERVERVAFTDFTVLIEGESGTGKELVARQLHELSQRRHGPFVAVNCAALVETLLEAELFGIEERTATGVRGRRGKFENADGGTLFLDEVSDLSGAAQAKLLRAIQELAVERVGGHGLRRVDVRIVAASNRPLSAMVATGAFRGDLFYRLSGVEIHVPPLRSRSDDVIELAEYFLSRHRDSRDLTLSFAAGEALKQYHWPGNVRELERLIERAVALAELDRIDLEDLPPHVRGDYGRILIPAAANNDSMRAWGSRYARLVFDRCAHNKRRTCRILGISYHTLDAYLRYTEQTRPGGRTKMPAWVKKSNPVVEAG